MSDQKILLIEDEPHLRFSLKFNLETEGFKVVEADNGLDAVKQYETEKPFAAIVLDVQIPEMDGFRVAEKIRSTDEKTQILMLTARAADEDRVRGLKAGVDDYITKPFHLEELMLRIHRMAERSKIIKEGSESDGDKPKVDVFTQGNLTLDCTSLKLSCKDQSTELTSLEADYLAQFMRYPGDVLTREYLLKEVWGITGLQETRTVDAFIVRLRKKLEEIGCGELQISSIRGRGYQMYSTN